MSEELQQVERTEGWDQEKNEYYESVWCPACGYQATRYEKGDFMVWCEGDPTCPVCSGALGAPVTPDDYGTSWKQTSEEGSGGCLAVAFAAFCVVSLIACLLVNFFAR